MAMTNEQLTKWIDEIFGTIDEIKQNSGDITGLTRSVKQLRDDLTATQEDVSDLEDQTAGVVSLPKAILQHFTDGSATQALDLVADIIPVQAGTGDPSPTNVRAITGFSSVTANTHAANYLDAATTTSGGYLDSEGRVQVVGGSDWSYSDYIGLVAGESYTLSGVENMGSTAKHCFYDATKNLLSSINTTEYTFTAPENCKYVRLSLRATTYNGIILSSGEEATPYEAYQANTATISLGSTVYGGTVDFTTGEFIVTHAIAVIDENTELITASSMPFVAAVLVGAKTSVQSQLSGMLCNQLTEVTQSSTWGVSGTCSRNSTQPTYFYFKINDDISTVEDAHTYLATKPIQVVYELATPVTTTLTPAQLSLLQGENNVSATSGPITLTYAPDNVLAEVYAYIQKRFDNLTASLAANRTTRKTTKTLTKKED